MNDRKWPIEELTEEEALLRHPDPEKARALGVTVLSEDEFLALVQSD